MLDLTKLQTTLQSFSNRVDAPGWWLPAAAQGAPPKAGEKLPLVGDESIMSKKAHGTTAQPVQENLRWNCDWKTADKICCFNRHYAEFAGYWTSTTFLQEEKGKEVTFYDSVTGRPLFIAPRGRTWE
eukprot:363150-Chlamydomonas_euryale.AAC.1